MAISINYNDNTMTPFVSKTLPPDHSLGSRCSTLHYGKHVVTIKYTFKLYKLPLHAMKVCLFVIL